MLQNIQILDILNLDTMLLDKGIWYKKCHPKIEGVFEAETHDEFFFLEDKSWWYKLRNKIIESGIKRNPPLDNTIVDVGAGNGFVAAYLEKCGFQTILFEMGLQGINNAKKRGLNNLVNAPLDKTTVKPNSIPAIGLFDVLEHVENESDFLCELYAVLKNDGMIYISLPAHNFLWSGDDQRAGHFRRYSLKGIRKILEDIGFGIVYESYFFRYLSLPIFVLRALPYKLFSGRCQTKEFITKTTDFVVPDFVEKFLSFIYDRDVKKISCSQISHGASIFITATKRSSK